MVIRVRVGVGVETKITAKKVLVLDLNQKSVVVHGIGVEEPLLRGSLHLGVQETLSTHQIISSKSNEMSTFSV